MSHQDNSPKEIFNDFVQIGVVVRDIDRTMQVLSQLFGIGPFRTIIYPPPDRPDIERSYYGQPGNFRYRVAFAELGPIELELIQPCQGRNIWADWLETHGESIHHIRFNVPDVEPVVEYLTQHDIGVSQKGSGLRPGTTWVNFDTADLIGFTIEIMNKLPGTDGRTPQIMDGKVLG
jgi:methylmalonyl-CoA/ethylmalonyl-CoA epimerase